MFEHGLKQGALKQAGFTLLEVLVAMAIFAVAAMALLNAGRDQLQSSTYLENKTFAHWVAMNQIAEMQAAGSLPDVGRGEQRVSMAGRDWKIVTQVDNSPISNVRRLTVDVSLAPVDFGDNPPVVTSLTAFIGKVQHAQSAISTAP